MLTKKIINADLCVVGGGIAGTFAAISAARQGVNVVLMQERPMLGGNASSEIRMWICGAQGDGMRETGLIEELMLRNLYYNPTKNHYIFDNLLLEMAEAEENITLLLNCTCMDGESEEGQYDYGRIRRIRSVTGYQMTTQCFYEVKAKFYADCSGDSILAPLSGAEFRVGREGHEDFGEETHVTVSDDLSMGNSCLLQGRETNGDVPFIRPESAADISAEQLRARKTELYNEYENFWYLELGGDRDFIADSEKIGAELRRLALGAWSRIKSDNEFNGKKFDLEFLGMLPGKRETRRYVGEYTMKQQDISKAVRFPDTVAYGGWPIDDHFPAGFYHPGKSNRTLKTDAPYPIPYRILYSSNVDNLFFAGRNVSATHTSLSSIRVMATCGLMGQAIGFAAALSVKYCLSPHGVYEKKISELQGCLLDADCFLPYFKRHISPICLQTDIRNGSDILKNGEDRQNRIYGGGECGLEIQNGIELSYSFAEPAAIESIHFVFDSDLDRRTLPGGACERSHGTRCNILKSSPIMHMPKTLCKDFDLEIECEGGEHIRREERENKLRAYHIPIGKKLKSISLTLLSNWGGGKETRLISFDFK